MEHWEQTTQFKHWRFTAAELQELKPNDISTEDQHEILSYYLHKLTNLCKHFKLSARV